MALVVGEGDEEAASGTGVPFQEPADLSFERTAVQSSPGLLDTSAEAAEAFFDVEREAFVHGLLLLAPLRRTAQDKGLIPFSSQLRLDTLTHHLPAALLDDLRRTP